MCSRKCGIEFFKKKGANTISTKREGGALYGTLVNGKQQGSSAGYVIWQLINKRGGEAFTKVEEGCA